MKTKPIFLVVVPLLVAACGGVNSSHSKPDPKPEPASTFVAQYAPTLGLLPFPNDLMFSGSTDGTINIPVPDPTDYSNPSVTLNELDGWSTTAAITVSFTEALDPASIVLGFTVRMFDGARELGDDDVVVVLATPTTVRIMPLRPLKAQTTYLVVLTRDLQNLKGDHVERSDEYAAAGGDGLLVDRRGRSMDPLFSDQQAAVLKSLRPVVKSNQNAAVALGVDREHIALCWTFTTQSIGNVLEAVHASIASRFSTAIRTGLTTADLGLGLPGFADIYAGVIDVEYFLDNTDPLDGFWRGLGDTPLTAGNPTPARRSIQTIPLLLTIPNGLTKPAGGWPVVIFQHGITRNRTDMLAVADAMAAAGYATIAIDLPLHGVTDQSNPFYLPESERTFDLDVMNNGTGAPGSDGVIDDSGTFFINLTNLLNSRDNARQAVADLFGLVAALPDLDIDGEGGDFDADQIVFLGHSLGAMVGTPFLAIETGVKSGVLVAPGGGLMKLLEGSPAFGPVIVGGLAAAGLVQGSPEFEAFMVAGQTVFDSADPVNYGAAAAASQPLYALIMEGDFVVPNAVAGTPISGTLPLFAAMGIQPIRATTATTQGSVRFVGGDHGSLLDPTASLPVTLEMQSSIAGFFATGGTVIPITDASVVR